MTSRLEDLLAKAQTINKKARAKQAEQHKEILESTFYSTKDPTKLMDGQPLPAATTLLYQVCDNDPKKFEEACRLVELFMMEALRLQ